MLIIENIRLAFRALWTNKMRAFLTILGIIIGIGSVLAIMTVSSSLYASVSDSFEEMGVNNITVALKQREEQTEARSNGMKFGAFERNNSVEEEDRITDEMIEELKKTFSGQVASVALSESVASGTAHSGSDSANVSVQGVNESFFAANNITLLAGRKIKEADLDGNRRVIIVSDKVVENMFDGDSEKALSAKISVEADSVYYDYYIVGIYKYEQNGSISSMSDADVTTEAYIPLTTGKVQNHEDKGYTRITVTAASGTGSVSEFAEQIEAFFAPYYVSNEDYEISTSTMESMTESMEDMIGTVTVAISFIAGISLIVGGIGVMNIMLVSVTERTREIGMRKAVGAKNSSIRLQFITESVVLCLVGGGIGIVLGFVLGAIAAGVLGYSAAVPVTAIVAAFGFSVVIGVFFGYYPAGRAARLNPIDALRYE